MEDLKEHITLEHRINAANTYSNNVRDSQIKFITRSMKSAEEFYYKLAIISASTITFSVSFVSYISTTSNALLHTSILFTSWVLLILSLLGSIYRNHFHSNFLHYQLQKEYLISKIEAEKLAKEQLEKYPETIINSYEGIDKLIEVSDERMAAYLEAKEYNEIRELFYDLLWSFCLKIAHIGFFFGMSLMVFFAIANLK